MAQEEVPTYTTAELQVGVTGVAYNDTTIFTLSKVDKVVYCNYSASSQNCYVHYDAADPGEYVIRVAGNQDCSKLGFFVQFCGETATLNVNCTGGNVQAGAKPLKKGLFKLSLSFKSGSTGNTTEKGYIYYDNRDSRFPSGALANCSASCYSPLTSNDLIIRYNGASQKIEYSFLQAAFAEVTTGKLFTIEELNAKESPCYDNYLVRYFVNLTSITRGEYDNPVLIWDPPFGPGRPQFESYIIQRSVNGSPFEDIDYLFSETESSYTDASVWWDPNNTGKIELTYQIITSYAQGQENYHYSNRKSIEVTNEFPMKRAHPRKEIVNGITVNPNPANGVINIQTHFLGDISSVEISDIIGNTFPLKRQAGNESIKVYSLNTQPLTSGVYFVVVKAGQEIYTKKFQVVK